jgi:hypothetical protein
MVMLDIATRFEPAMQAKGRALAVTGLLVGLVALPAAFVPSMSRPALVLAGVAFLVSGIAVVGALGRRRAGRNIAAAGTALGVLAGVTVLVVQATYAPGLPAREAPDPVPPAVVPALADVKVSVGKYGRQGVPLKVTSSADRLRSVDLTVAAVTAKGRRIAVDTVSASRLAPGATSTVHAFSDEPAALARQLRTARFHLIEAASFA